MEKYIQFAKELRMIDAMIISPKQLFFDIRAILKCRWGCEYSLQENIKCHFRDTTYQERVAMVRRYNHILLVHSHDERALSEAVLKIERAAFQDGRYFAFAIRACHLCEICAIKQGDTCPTPDKVRPCDSIFGIDVYKTARDLGLPCEVLKTKDDVQNRYGFVLLDYGRFVVKERNPMSTIKIMLCLIDLPDSLTSKSSSRYVPSERRRDHL